MAVLVDTNVLIFAVQQKHPWHGESIRAIEKLLSTGEVVCVFLQNLAEFWNVCTRPANKNGLGLDVLETESRLRRLDSFLKVLSDTDAVYPEWRKLVVKHEVKGVQVHDARIAAGMRVHGVTQILTYNPQDFERYDRITVIHPEDVK